MKGLDVQGKWGTVKPTIPDYAFDKRTKEGQAMGRGDRHFLTEATKLIPEHPGRDWTYLDQLLANMPPADGEGHDVITRDGKAPKKIVKVRI
jgi:hypothetical protein